jgi:hypothetical protein
MRGEADIAELAFTLSLISQVKPTADMRLDDAMQPSYILRPNAQDSYREDFLQ